MAYKRYYNNNWYVTLTQTHPGWNVNRWRRVGKRVIGMTTTNHRTLALAKKKFTQQKNWVNKKVGNTKDAQFF